MDADADLHDMEGMTDRDRTANAAALFLPAREAVEGGGTYQPPALEVGGVLVAVYAHDGALVVTIDPSCADPEVFTLHGETAAVPVAVSIGESQILETAMPEDFYTGSHRKAGA
jgi:hypothetical protein